MIQQHHHHQHPPHHHRFPYSSRGSGGGGRGDSNAKYGSNINDNGSFSGSNRSRSESGSSTESSKGSRGSNGRNNGKPRRRSHRPRGCRGGANKRKHILQQQQQQQQQWQQMSLQQQQESQQRHHHTSQRHEVMNRNPNFKSSSYHGMPPPSNHQRGSSSHDFSHQITTSNSITMALAGRGAREGNSCLYMDDYHRCREAQEREETTVDRRHPSKYSGPGSYHGSNSSLEQPQYDALTTSLSFISQNDSTRFPGVISMNENSTDESFMGGASIIHRSYSDTSSSVSDGGSSFQSNNKQKDYLYGDDASLFPAGPNVTRLENNISSTCGVFNILPNGELVDDQILPPLPSGAFTKHQAIPSGPNPYALTNSSRSNLQTGTCLFMEDKARSSSDQVLQPRQSNINNLPLKIESLIEKPRLACMPLGKLDSLDNQQNELIQNQVMIEKCDGGSLFVTSPRSFLMGAASKNDCTSSFIAPKKVCAAERMQPKQQLLWTGQSYVSA
mmetsp:Transcript_44455/g.107559  ORF Transcript_44455/g.107559 Transcript_44455/m.107559 type:complete len:501 (+) Transcript_44455:345-1847(+)